MNRELKMWLAIRTDVKMSPGKLAVQAAHAASGLTLLNVMDRHALFASYFANAMPKIAVQVASEGALARVAFEARAAGLPSYLVTDAGRSEVPAGTMTVCAFGPAYRDDLPPFLKRLRLLEVDQ